jgi:IrrE N-terminal-like domain
LPTAATCPDIYRKERHSAIRCDARAPGASSERPRGRPRFHRQQTFALQLFAGEPFVFLNTLKSGEHSRFDAAELGHLVLHRHAAPNGQEAEQDANAFASALLMPSASVRAHAPRSRRRPHQLPLAAKINHSELITRIRYDPSQTTSPSGLHASIHDAAGFTYQPDLPATLASAPTLN